MSKKPETTISKIVESSSRKWSNLSETYLNKQINAELSANYFYLLLAQHFEKNDVALHNVAKYFYKSAEEEYEHAKSLMKYQNKRCGNVEMFPITIENLPEDFTLLKAFQKALKLEEDVYDKLLQLMDTAPNDPQFQDYITSEYLHEQINSIHELKSFISNIHLCGPQIGVYMFDKHFFTD